MHKRPAFDCTRGQHFPHFRRFSPGCPLLGALLPRRVHDIHIQNDTYCIVAIQMRWQRKKNEGDNETNKNDDNKK